jgi:hypothetical protein
MHAHVGKRTVSIRTDTAQPLGSLNRPTVGTGTTLASIEAHRSGSEVRDQIIPLSGRKPTIGIGGWAKPDAESGGAT